MPSPGQRPDGAGTDTTGCVAGLGAYTTISSLARDTVALIEQRNVGLASAYVGATLVVGIAAVALGVTIAG